MCFHIYLVNGLQVIDDYLQITTYYSQNILLFLPNLPQLIKVIYLIL